MRDLKEKVHVPASYPLPPPPTHTHTLRRLSLRYHAQRPMSPLFVSCILSEAEGTLFFVTRLDKGGKPASRLSTPGSARKKELWALMATRKRLTSTNRGSSPCSPSSDSHCEVVDTVPRNSFRRLTPRTSPPRSSPWFPHAPPPPPTAWASIL